MTFDFLKTWKFWLFAALVAVLVFLALPKRKQPAPIQHAIAAVRAVPAKVKAAVHRHTATKKKKKQDKSFGPWRDE